MHKFILIVLLAVVSSSAMGGRLGSFSKNSEIVQVIELRKQLALAEALADDYAKSHSISDSNPDQYKRWQQQYLDKMTDELRAKAKIKIIASAEIAALVNGVPIPQTRIDFRVKIAISKKGNTDSPSDDLELRKAMQEKMINLELVAQEAIRRGLDKNDDVIEKTELAEQKMLVESFVQGYIENHPISDAKPDQREHLLMQSMKNALNDLKEKAKIEYIASSDTAALVNNVPISQARINKRVKVAMAEGKSVADSSELRRAILEDMVNTELMVQEGVRYLEVDISNNVKKGAAKDGKSRNSVYANADPTKKESLKKSKIQLPSEPKWMQEPSSFMGIKLGDPLPKSVTECSGIPMVRPCYFRKEAGRQGEYNITATKVEPLNDTAWIKTLDGTFDGAVGNIYTTFQSSSFSQVEEILTIKYGSPHKTKIEKLKTKGGAEFDNIVLLWTGEEITIRAESFAERLIFSDGMIYDIGKINVFTAKYLDRKSQEIRNEAQRSAAGL